MCSSISYMDQFRDSVVGGAGRMLDIDGDGVVTLQEVEESAHKAYRRVSAVVDTTRNVVDKNRTILGGLLGLFLLRYGKCVPFGGVIRWKLLVSLLVIFRTHLCCFNQSELKTSSVTLMTLQKCTPRYRCSPGIYM